MDESQYAAHQRSCCHADPGIVRMIGGRKSRYGAHDHHSLDTKVEDARTLGEYLADRGVDE